MVDGDFVDGEFCVFGLCGDFGFVVDYVRFGIECGEFVVVGVGG